MWRILDQIAESKVLFNVDPPACFTCGLNNMDPTTYDVPGTFFYARASLRM